MDFYILSLFRISSLERSKDSYSDFIAEDIVEAIRRKSTRVVNSLEIANHIKSEDSRLKYCYKISIGEVK